MSKSLVDKATVDTDRPAGGAVLKELADRTRQSLQECALVESLLTRKLESTNLPFVKKKVLQTIRYICLNGREEFRISFHRNNQRIRDCIHFKCKPDPLRGDQPAEAVRAEARECMNAIFHGARAQQNNVSGDRIQGLGSSAGGGGGSGSSGSRGNNGGSKNDYGAGTFSTPQSASGMVGFGNYDPNKDKSFMTRMSEKMSTPKEPPKFKPYQHTQGYSGGGAARGMPNRVEPAPATAGGSQSRKKGHVGGVWGSGDDSSSGGGLSAGSSGLGGGGGGFGGGGSFGGSAGRSSGGPGGTWGHGPGQGGRTSGGGGGVNEGGQSRAVEPSEFEMNVIDKATAPVGTGSRISAADERAFVQTTDVFNQWMVAKMLDEKLGYDQDPRTQTKALILIAAILKKGSVEVEEYFCENEANLSELEQSVNKTIAAKALKVMVSIGTRDAPTQTRPPPQVYQQQPQYSQPEVVVEDVPPNPVEATLQEQEQASIPEPASDLLDLGNFDLMSGGGEGNGSINTGNIDMISTAFSPNNITPTPNPTPVSAPEQVTSTPTPAPSAFNFLGGGGTGGQQEPPPQQQPNIFGNMSLATTGPQQDQQGQQQPAASGFSFMSSPANPPPPQKQELSFLMQQSQTQPPPPQQQQQAGAVDALSALMANTKAPPTTHNNTAPSTFFGQQQLPPSQQQQQTQFLQGNGMNMSSLTSALPNSNNDPLAAFGTAGVSNGTSGGGGSFAFVNSNTSNAQTDVFANVTSGSGNCNTTDAKKSKATDSFDFVADMLK